MEKLYLGSAQRWVNVDAQSVHVLFLMSGTFENVHVNYCSLELYWKVNSCTISEGMLFNTADTWNIFSSVWDFFACEKYTTGVLVSF